MYLGFDIGGTKCAVVVGDSEGNIVKKYRCPTSAPDETIESLCLNAEKWIGEYNYKIEGTGISCGSPLDPEKGIIQSPPNLPGWDNVPIAEMLGERFSAPAKLTNDANACALAEYTCGAGKGSRNMIFLTFGTGFGAGIIIDGKIYNGSCGNAGEIGHVRAAEFGPVGYGKQGSYEGFASGGGMALMGKTIAQEYLQQGKPLKWCKTYEEISNITARLICDEAKKGDSAAMRVVEITGKKLGEAVALLVDIINPDRVVIGSVYQRAEELFRPFVEEVCRRECLVQSYNAVKILPAMLGDSIGDIAALSVAKAAAEL